MNFKKTRGTRTVAREKFIAIKIRLALTVILAPNFKKFKRIVPTVAREKEVLE